MSDLITDEMVETAAKARWDYERVESGDTTEWDMRYPSFREFDSEAMRAALEAVTPLIAAKAWDEGHASAQIDWKHVYDGHPVEPGELCDQCCQPNPYTKRTKGETP